MIRGAVLFVPRGTKCHFPCSVCRNFVQNQKKMQKNEKKFAKNLHISKKCSTFASSFKKEVTRNQIKKPKTKPKMKAIIEINKNACYKITLEHRPNTYTHNGSGDWYVECFCDEDGGIIRKATNDIVQAAKFFESLVCKYGGYRRYKKQRYNIADLIDAEEKRGFTVRLD